MIMNKLSSFVLVFVFHLILFKAYPQNTFLLYPDRIPNSTDSPNEEVSEIEDGILKISQISIPMLTVYQAPSKIATGTAVIICPGGGYWVEAAGHEGADVAKKLNEMGITAFVLKYRIPNNKTMINKELGPVQDGQQALMVVRSQAKKWHIHPNKIGMMGFSAGGHLASTVGTHFSNTYIANPKIINLRPDFMILVYPVISLTDQIGNSSVREQLLGPNASLEKIQEYSNEYHVTDQTPPTFLVQAKDDEIKVQNSICFADSLKAHHVPYELYLYEKGGHGYGMYNKASNVKWMDLVNLWLKKMNFK